MKRFISILVALVLVLVCGIQIAAYVGDIVSPCYEVCPDSYNGHHDFSYRETYISSYEQCDADVHIIVFTTDIKCSYCGKISESITSRDANTHSFVNGVCEQCGETQS